MYLAGFVQSLTWVNPSINTFFLNEWVFKYHRYYFSDEKNYLGIKIILKQTTSA